MLDLGSRGGPPKARLAFRVGVVGHRPNRLPADDAGRAAIRSRLAQVLTAVKAAAEAFHGTHPDAELYAPSTPELRGVTALAEGADRDFAEEALRLGYALCAPLPFARSEYEKDFEGPASLERGSLARFRSLLERARDLTLFELDGQRADPAAAYGAAGRVVLNQSDLLVAVWDGADAQGRGGTVDTLREAVDFHVPVLWIQAKAPFGWALLQSPADLARLNAGADCAPAAARSPAAEDDRRLAEAIREIVFAEFVRPRDLHRGDHHATERDHVATYFAERRPHRNLGLLWKPFRDLVGSLRLTLPRWRSPDFVSEVRVTWPTAGDGPNGARQGPVTSWINGRLRAHYAWSDKLADVYADKHRSAFLLASLLAALAVLVALLPMAIGEVRHARVLDLGSIACELGILGLMVFLLGARRGWHERWLDYRVLAELIRQLRLLIPMGGSRPLPRSPAHLASYGDPNSSWMYWQMRAIAREVGIPNARVDRGYCLECLDYLANVASAPHSGQLDFHKLSFRRSENIHRRLHKASLFLFWLSIFGIGLHLIATPSILDLACGGRSEQLCRFRAQLDLHALGRWLVLISAFTPALGAALASINNQGEFARIAKRSMAMADVFARIEKESEGLRRAALDGNRAIRLAAVTGLASQMAQRMVEENLDWRVVVLDLPHVAG